MANMIEKVFNLSFIKRNKGMFLIEAGRDPHSYKISFCGIRIRFRNIFALKNNKIILVSEKGAHVKKKIKGLNIKFKGANAKIKIYSPCPKFSNTTIECGDNVNISIGASSHRIFNSYFSVLSDNASLIIGNNASIRGATIVITENKNLSVNIGNDCLIAANVKIWTTDFHTVIDSKTSKPINPPCSINIGNHCWICEGVTIAKGVSLLADTVVASKSYVTKSFDKPNIIIGGVPAKIIKENITWSSEPYDRYNK